MANFEDPYKVLCYLRKAFIEHDESGMCAEIVGDRLPHKKDLFPHLVDMYESEEEEPSSSPEDYSDWDFERRDLKKIKFRGGTPEKRDAVDAEDDRLKEDNAISPPICSPPGRGGDREIQFEREEIKKDKKIGRSLLSCQLEQRSVSPRSPFVEYAKYDGSYELRAATKTFKIFLTMLAHSERDYPLKVCVLSSAKVSDLIGLTCFKYMAENPNGSVRLKEDVNEYGLYIADERGEVDWEFPSLDPAVKIGKFCLQYLALVELSDINIPKAAVTERNFISPESQDEECELEKEAEWEALERFMEDLKKMAALIHETFLVKMVCKKRKKVRVALAISFDNVRIELDPDSESGGKVVPKGRVFPLEFDAREIVACEVVKRKSRDRTLFRIVIHTEDASGNVSYENNDFESDTDIVDKIIKKLQNVLEMRGSALREKYLGRAREEKKTGMRRIFNFLCRR